MLQLVMKYEVNLTWDGLSATFFTPGLGACGIQSTSSDHIVAVSNQFFNTFP